jgi:hypothetical protein
MREALTRDRLHELMQALAGSAPRDVAVRVYFIGGATAVDRGWRVSTIDVDLHATDDRLFADILKIKERLHVNVELARPEDFVPPLAGSNNRHVLIETIGKVGFFHYDPYAQLLSKIVRGFRQDLEDAAHLLDDRLVEAERFAALVRGITDESYSRYPNLSRPAVESAVEEFLSEQERRLRDERDLETLGHDATKLNREAGDVLGYQDE